jgi:hypothetical protein
MAQNGSYRQELPYLLSKLLPEDLTVGGLGVVMARAGVGKTAFLVRLGLEELQHSRNVLHVALGQNLDQVRSHYDSIVTDLFRGLPIDQRETILATLRHNRVIKTFADHQLTPTRLQEVMQTFEQAMGFKPSCILVDGYDWEGPVHEVAKNLSALKSLVRERAKLWLTAVTYQDGAGPNGQLPPPCEAFTDQIDMTLLLNPQGDRMTVRYLTGLSSGEWSLVLAANTLLPVGLTERLPANSYTLLSGGACGSESAFGMWAERYGVREINFSFEGHEISRSRGVVKLNEGELHQGDVSLAYLVLHMHRTYPQTPEFRKVLQSIWHQVQSAGEVFAIGVIQQDSTVRGGTGWAVELARHWDKPIYVFDQERCAWHRWRANAWVEAPTPVITHNRFTGTGTRNPNEAAKKAIRDLFEGTFGPLPK